MQEFFTRLEIIINIAVNVFVGVNFVIRKAGKQGDLFAVNVLSLLVLIYAGTLQYGESNICNILYSAPYTFFEENNILKKKRIVNSVFLTTKG